jgi:hypothetical protein
MLIRRLSSGISSDKIKTIHFQTSPPTLQIPLVFATQQLYFHQPASQINTSMFKQTMQKLQGTSQEKL